MPSPFAMQLPNLLTTLRLLLAIPICWLILEQQFALVLWLAFFAGLSDGLDGWLARRWNAQSRYGSVVDPISDKALLSGAFVCLAVIGVLPWWLAAVVLARDLLIFTGALCYHGLIGRYDMEPSLWGKLSTLIQISVVLAVLFQQVFPIFPQVLLEASYIALVVLAVISGGHYVVTWGRRAADSRKAGATDRQTD